jgi:hypothetical protein
MAVRSAKTHGTPRNPRVPPNAPPAMRAAVTGMSRHGRQVTRTAIGTNQDLDGIGMDSF